MTRDLPGLARVSYDLLVVGGGIHGACAAWDAASRGLSVALVERDDFGGATSANSLKIIHGGLRYLQSADFRRVRQSIRERAALLRIAPHLVRPMPVLVPLSRRLKESRAALTLALRLSEAIGGESGLPRGRLLGRRECLEKFPWLEHPGLTGGALWYDAQAVNSERLTLSFLLSAAGSGAALANHAEVVGLIREQGRVTGARVKDRIGGDELEVRAGCVLNTAGPWAHRIVDLARGTATAPELQALAVNLVHRSSLGDTAVGIRSRRDLARDPVGGGGRFLFLAPWRGHTLIGTSYRRLNRVPGRAELKEDDLRDLLQDCNEACPALQLSWPDVTFYHWGFLPLDRAGHGPASPLADAPRIVDHAAEGLEGLITAVGVKYTTARRVAEEALQHVFARLGRTAPACRTAQLPLWGGAGAAAPALPGDIDALSARRLEAIYGSAAAEVARTYSGEPGWAAPIAEGCAVLTCEVRRAMREEMAASLADVVFRRTDLGSAGEPPRTHLLAAAALMAAEKGWSQEKVEHEIDLVLRSYDPLPRGAEAA